MNSTIEVSVEILYVFHLNAIHYSKAVPISLCDMIGLPCKLLVFFFFFFSFETALNLIHSNSIYQLSTLC